MVGCLFVCFFFLRKHVFLQVLISIYGSQDKRSENVIKTFMSETPKQKCYRRVFKEAQVIWRRFLSPHRIRSSETAEYEQIEVEYCQSFLSGQCQPGTLLHLTAHSELWDRADPDTSFATLKSVYIASTRNIDTCRIDLFRNSLQSCLKVFHSIFDIFLSIVFIHPIILFYHIYRMNRFSRHMQIS